MKVLLNILFLLLISVIGIAQPYPSDQQSGNASTIKTERGAIRGLKGFQLPNYTDTATANLGYIKAYSGALIYTTLDSNVWVRNTDTTRWIIVGSGGSSGGGLCGDSVIVSITFLPDSTGFEYVRCNGVKDTIPINGGVSLPTDTTGRFVTSAFQRGDSVFYVKNGVEVFMALIPQQMSDTFYIDIFGLPDDNGFELLDNYGFRDTVVINAGGGSFDTTAIYAAIGQKLDISDTSAMLAPYVKYVDTASMLSPYLRSIDTTGKWYSDIAKLNDSTWRFYKGSGYYDLVVPQGGGSTTPDTVYAKFPIQVDQSGEEDTLKFKLPPQSIPVNLHATDTLEAQFMKVDRKLISVLSDTVRWTTTGSAPSGTPEIYYRWSQLGSTVNLQIWAYYPINGTSVTGAAITLPADCPTPNVPGSWTEANFVLAQGAGGIYINKTRAFTDLGTSSAESVLKRNAGNTRWELQNKSGNVSARYTMWNIVYETSDY